MSTTKRSHSKTVCSSDSTNNEACISSRCSLRTICPGWDVSRDNGHLAAYGLGSPFPEDSKLCAALSSFWPAVAPDASRTFWAHQIPAPSPTISPLTDEEIGQSGNIPWDGVTGPKIINTQNTPQIEYSDFNYTDYVNNMLQNKFTLKLTGQVDISKYKSRILVLAVAYRAISRVRLIFRL